MEDKAITKTSAYGTVRWSVIISIQYKRIFCLSFDCFHASFELQVYK